MKTSKLRSSATKQKTHVLTRDTLITHCKNDYFVDRVFPELWNLKLKARERMGLANAA